jgi:hypothetical protein
MHIRITIVLVLLCSKSANILADTVIIINVNIVSTTEARILQNRHVLLEDGVIKKISKTPIRLFLPFDLIRYLVRFGCGSSCATTSAFGRNQA